jgi:signal transduction histidine kinase
VCELLDDFELIIAEKGAQITCTNLPCLDVNRGQMRQVFHNLLSNALKFSKADIPPEIHIEAKNIATKSFEATEAKKGPYCLISIRDNGIGFDEKYVSNIFSLFERLNSKDLFEGTGIGLAIAKKVIDKHHGLITAHSRVGEGATFDIILPVTRDTV